MTYYGGFQNNLREGQGNATHDKTGEAYTGQWKAGLKHGTGEESNPNELYEG